MIEKNVLENILPQDFYNRDTTTVAQELLGKLLVHKIGERKFVGVITETEACLPKDDLAAHGYIGKIKRNLSLFKSSGHAYVHSMRQYFLLDVVTEKENIPGSVLIRSIEPIENMEGVINGPGKVCRAMQISKELDGVDVTSETSGLYITTNINFTAREIKISNRVGISKAKELLLRFGFK